MPETCGWGQDTAQDVVGQTNLSGKFAIVTGGECGIGKETVRVLASAGADVVLTSHDAARAEAAATELRHRHRGARGNVLARQLDLGSLASVDAFAAQVARELPKIDILILNSSSMVLGPPKQTTSDGFELCVGTNHLAHLRLVQLLLPKLQSQECESRVVWVASGSHHDATREALQDLSYATRPMDSSSYAVSKLCNVLAAKELARRAEEGGWPIKALSVCPGYLESDFVHPLRGIFPIYLRLLLWASRVPGLRRAVGVDVLPVERGAAAAVFAALEPQLRSGTYLQDGAVAEPSKLARDAELACEVWAQSEALLAAATAAAAAQQ